MSTVPAAWEAEGGGASELGSSKWYRYSQLQEATGSPGSPEEERWSFLLYPQGKEEKKKLCPQACLACLWSNHTVLRGTQGEREPPVRAAVGERQITFPAACPFLTQGTETHHFLASGYQRTAQDGRGWARACFCHDPQP